MERNSRLIGWLVLIVGLLCSIRGEAVDVNSAQALKDAVNSRTSYVRLIANIELNNSTLTVSSGTITLDLNGKTLSATRTSNGAATCISVNGGNLTITGGGIISATAKGTTGGSLGSWKNGYDGIALSYNVGNVVIRNATFKATATKGAGIVSGSDGTAYTIDTNGTAIKMLIPTGAYMDSNEYENTTGLKSTSTTVSLINYNVTYNPNGGMPQPANATYTIESSNLSLPKVSKEGYDLLVGSMVVRHMTVIKLKRRLANHYRTCQSGQYGF